MLFRSEPVDRMDFFPQPGIRLLESMEWVVRRHLHSLETLRSWVARGWITQDAFDQLVALGSAPDDDTVQSPQRWVDTWQGRATQMRKREPHSQLVEVLEYWCVTHPAEFLERLPEDQRDTHRRILVANRQVLLSDTPTPYRHRQLPFGVHRPIPDPHYFDAPGKVEIGAKAQATMNRLWNQRLDVGDQIADQMWAADETMLVSKDFTSQPGRVLWTRGNPREAITSLVPNASGIAITGE